MQAETPAPHCDQPHAIYVGQAFGLPSEFRLLKKYRRRNRLRHQRKITSLQKLVGQAFSLPGVFSILLV